MGGRHHIRLCLGVCLLMASGGLVGCSNPLYPKDLPRSPYERYMVLRGDERLLYEEDAAFSDGPALRQRLAPLRGPYER